MSTVREAVLEALADVVADALEAAAEIGQPVEVTLIADPFPPTLGAALRTGDDQRTTTPPRAVRVPSGPSVRMTRPLW